MGSLGFKVILHLQNLSWSRNHVYTRRPKEAQGRIQLDLEGFVIGLDWIEHQGLVFSQKDVQLQARYQILTGSSRQFNSDQIQSSVWRYRAQSWQRSKKCRKRSHGNGADKWIGYPHMPAWIPKPRRKKGDGIMAVEDCNADLVFLYNRRTSGKLSWPRVIKSNQAMTDIGKQHNKSRN